MTTQEPIETSLAPRPGSLLAKYMGDDGAMDLAEFGLDNLGGGTRLNRLFINHELNQFGSKAIDDFHRQEFSAIVLGRVAQRQIFPPREAGVKQRPLCQSNDAVTGYASNEFDVSRTGITDLVNQDGQPVTLTKKGTADIDNHERVKLNCADCALSDNGLDENGKGVWRKPECSDLSTLIVLVDFFQNGTVEPAAISFKSSALRPVHAYLKQVVDLRLHPVMLYTEFSLTQVDDGDSVVYSVPVLKRGEPTEPGPDGQFYEDHLQQWEDLKEMLEKPYLPTAEDYADDDDDTEAPTVPVDEAGTPF